MPDNNNFHIAGWVTKAGVQKQYLSDGVKCMHWVTLSVFRKKKEDGTKIYDFLSVKFWDAAFADKLLPGVHVAVSGWLSSWAVKNDAGIITETRIGLEAGTMSIIIDKPKENAATPPAGITPSTPNEPPPDGFDDDISFS